jgi:hypothetical protein
VQVVTPELTVLSLSRAQRDDSFWPRRRLSDSRVREFVEIYRHHGREGLDPIVVASADADGNHLVLDGWHRIAAALEASLTHLPAVIRHVASDQEAFEVAVQLASRGPRPMSRGEKRDAVDRLLEMDPRRTDRAIAEIAGVSHPFLAERRRLRGRPREEGGSRALSPERYALSVMKADRSMFSLRQQGPVDAGGALTDHEAGGEMALFLAAAAEKCCGGEAEIWLERLGRWARDAGPWLKSSRE